MEGIRMTLFILIGFVALTLLMMFINNVTNETGNRPNHLLLLKKNATFTEKSNGTMYWIGSGRLGNRVVQYAAVSCISDITQQKLVAGRDYDLHKLFPNINTSIITKSMINQTKRVIFYGTGIYTPEIIKQCRGDIVIGGCFVSWKYFQQCRSKLLNKFSFHAKIHEEAAKSLKGYYNAYLLKKNVTHSDSLVFVGVHVRRGDFLSSVNKKFGFNVATSNYITHAIEYYNNKYNCIFLIISEDMKWCKENIKNSSNIYFAGTKSVFVDFAMLSMCNHSIMTVGTFGWFSAWLAGGDVVYYSTFTLPNSKLSRKMNASDVYPPTWTAMT